MISEEYKKIKPGSAVIPQVFPIKSPIDLVMASPGISSAYTHTLKGPDS
tara:strand:+ start:498 stop:644 length:147 start_codon:yes stop_codon:yes gene_type:complete